MRFKGFRIMTCALLMLLLTATAISAVLPTAAADTTVYLGDREDLFLGRDSLDGFGWNTAHSGEPITIGSQAFEKGLGFHCQPDRDAYAEFDISSLGKKYFAASVGVLKEASYFLEWGSISFHVYGDGELLASTPVQNWGDEPYFLTCSVEGIKTLKLVQKSEGNYACDAGVWGDARLTDEKPTAPSTEENGDKGETSMDPNKTDLPQPNELVSGDYAYISDLYWLHNQAYGGGLAMRDSNCAGESIWSCDLKKWEKGIGILAESSSYNAYVDVNIEDLGYTKLATWYGVSVTLSGNDISMACIKFAVFGDGVMLFESDAISYNQPFAYTEVDVTGVKTLRLAVAGAPSISGAWGVWGGAVLSKSGDVDDVAFYKELVIQNPTPDTEADTKPVTETSTDPITEPMTEPSTELVTDVPEESTTGPEAPKESTTQASAGSGCGAITGGTALLMAGAAAIILKKRKED
ncbi:MAG: NPCBM/NEW2 domain-containing protein [Clostridia bacterium]|nr:NPCBM/NEW2 domain-containing protein [Clostridia bacterium]